MSTHAATLDWSPAPGNDFLAGHYTRAHLISFDGGITLVGSASPSVVHAPWSVEAAADPEELLVASIASCHMLWFLDFAKHAGATVARYHDEPQGRMGKMPSGRIGVKTCVLRPAVDALGPEGAPLSPDTLAELHRKAHHACNIANSLITDVRVEPAASPNV